MSLPRIGITMGDPAGIGPEIVLKALSYHGVYEVCSPVVLGDKKLLEDVAKNSIFNLKSSILNIKDLSNLNPKTIKPGRPNRACGEAVVSYIEAGVHMALKGEIDALVTCPINKEALKMIDFPFPGHTEFLAHLTKTDDFVMMMVGGGLRVSLVTIHLGLKDAIKGITEEGVLKTIRLTNDGLRDYFSIPQPRIGIAGLNPHAGEGGLFGDEEKEVITPAIEEARRMGIQVIGPLSPDTIFYRAINGEFDGIVAMYHDQGLIPVKLLAFNSAVNVTLGLPIIRTSVDHGTAYDIAGKGIANPSSLIEAIRLASEMVKARWGGVS